MTPDDHTGDSALTVSVVRSGGFAGLRRNWQVEVDPNDESATARWCSLIDACPWNEVDCDGDGVPDGFTYNVRANEHRATLTESQVDGPWSELIDAVRDETNCHDNHDGGVTPLSPDRPRLDS